ncbi:hypothetical protein HDU87_002890 [Geranomyces variabilis]|uniref:Peptidase S33 tripeptidyl aminopeptidase-like C-terminal domain-containing protein n=1 Tax=Geranomyces variabilis TaxID=109894 RepID=A0AAD5TD07_9FUNG|nr:hypothetical protein HDU87_002890 [Geranomyces variabilis]
MHVHAPADACPAEDDANNWNLESVLAIACANARPTYSDGQEGGVEELEREMFLFEAQHPMGYAEAATLGVGCTYWPVKPVETFGGPWNATTNHTVLLLANVLDPVTPVESARIAHGLLGNSRIVETEAQSN